MAVITGLAELILTSCYYLLIPLRCSASLPHLPNHSLLQSGAYAFLLSACEIYTCTLVHGAMYEERSARANSSSRVLAVVLRIFLIESYTRL